MSVYVETAYAKINLALHVRGRRSDGYHEIETLFAFLDAGDVLTATAAKDLTLSISGPFADGLGNIEDNLALRTARMLQNHFQADFGADVTLQKNLPIASGLGGGSADAAATARLLRKVWQLDVTDVDLANLIAPLGADIPACLSSVTAFGSGTGTALTPVDSDELAGMPTLLVNPNKSVYTSAVFRAWDGLDRGALGMTSALSGALLGRNDLEGPAIDICPEIGNILNDLKASRPVLSRMSGSGATCFAVYSTVEERDNALNSMDKTWWTSAGRLR